MREKPVILVVDDEDIERKMIVQIIKNEFGDEYGIVEASDGVDAVNLACKHLPYIVLMDIRMPLMNGLTALKEIFEAVPGISSIILTAHDEFEYAVQAIKLGVEDYILKPVRREKLLDAVRKVEKKRNMRLVKDEKEWKRQFDFFTPYVEDSIISAIVMDSYPPEKVRTILRRIYPENVGLWMAVAEYEKMEEDMTKLYEEVRHQLYSLGIKAIGSHLGRQIILLAQQTGEDDRAFSESLERCIVRKEKIKISPVGDVGECAILYRRMNTEDMPAEAGKISDSFFCDEKGIAIRIATRDIEGAVTMMEEMLMRQRLSDDSEKTAGEGMESKRIVIDHYLKMTVGAISLSQVRPFASYNESEKLKTAIRSYIDRRCKDVAESQSRRMPDMLNSVIRDIEEHYSDGFYSLSRAADHLGISAAYLSKIFKEQFGSTFTKYLNDVRIDEAKRMLHEEMEIAEVAEKCGFNSPNYFCKVFKKYTGTPAGDYRESLAGRREKKEAYHTDR